MFKIENVNEDIICSVYVGLKMEWLKEPPSRVEIGQKFNVSYQALADEDFYTMQNSAFPVQK